MSDGIGAEDLEAKEVKPKEWMLEPLIYQASLTLLYAPTGLGKSLMSFSLGAAVATNSDFLCWKAPMRRAKAYKVLFLDGEMTLGDNKERLTAIRKGLGKRITNEDLWLRSSCHFKDSLIPSICTNEGEDWFSKACEGKDLIIIDNLTCIGPPVARMTEEEAWRRIQPQLVALRNRGAAVILIHHSSKANEQYGTILKEHPMDYKIRLSRPLGPRRNEAAFNVGFEKARGKHASLLYPIYCKYSEVDGAAHWHWERLDEHLAKDVMAMSEYMKPHEIHSCSGLPLDFILKTIHDAKSNGAAEEFDYKNIYGGD